jgi:hypothetical protein
MTKGTGTGSLPDVISAIVVSYRSALLARAAISDLRTQAAEVDLPLEVLVVVNSRDASEASALEETADRVFLPERNLGYAGGLNLGIAAARGDLLLLSNPDLRFAPGALAALAGSARAITFGAVGPVFYLDAARRMLVPPFDEPHPFTLSRTRLARVPERARRLLRRDLSRAAALAAAARTGASLEVPALPGALLAVTRATLERVGPLDEAYALYYEENDWERRLRRLGGSLVAAGGAHVVHRYGRSTKGEPQAARWFAESERRYFTSHFGRWGERALAAMTQAAPWSLPPPPDLVDATLRWEPTPGRVAVLASPVPEMRPFAYAETLPGAASWQVPEDFLAGVDEAEPWFLRAVTLPGGETLTEGRLVRPGRRSGV